MIFTIFYYNHPYITDYIISTKAFYLPSIILLYPVYFKFTIFWTMSPSTTTDDIIYFDFYTLSVVHNRFNILPNKSAPSMFPLVF